MSSLDCRHEENIVTDLYAVAVRSSIRSRSSAERETVPGLFDTAKTSTGTSKSNIRGMRLISAHSPDASILKRRVSVSRGNPTGKDTYRHSIAASVKIGSLVDRQG